MKLLLTLFLLFGSYSANAELPQFDVKVDEICIKGYAHIRLADSTDQLTIKVYPLQPCGQHKKMADDMYNELVRLFTEHKKDKS